MSQEDLLRKAIAYEKLQDAKKASRAAIEACFLPGNPDAVPFREQINVFKDRSLQKLMRCGNRAAKTFTAMRDIAWKMMRNHPYRPDWNCESLGVPYTKTKAKKGWILAPSYDFIKETIWEMYLKDFIPEWYYTDDNGKEMITYHNLPEKPPKKITFRNGDTIEFKSYSQSDLALMGRKIDWAYFDEMPPRLLLISEVITRTFDLDGETLFGFTPLVENEDVKIYLDEKVKSGILSLHQWGVMQNPHFRDNPKRLAVVLAEWEHLPKGERNARLKGDWYYETKHGKVFSDTKLVPVDDFPIPPDWRRACFVDPAAHITGASLFAEDPVTKTWYCYKSVQIGDRKNTIDAEEICNEVLGLDKTDNFVYRKYDNAEAWFGASKVVRLAKFTPCIHKNVNSAIMNYKNVLKEGKVKVFKSCHELIKQHRDYEWGPDGTPKNKNKYHVLDTIMYFSREIPSPLAEVLKKEAPNEQEAALETAKAMVKMYREGSVTPSKKPNNVVKLSRGSKGLRRRRAR